MKLKLSVLSSLLFLSFFWANAHDPKLVSIKLIMKDEKWVLKTIYSGKSLEAAVQSYFKKPELVFKEDSLFKKYLNQYLQDHLAIEVNKYEKLELADFQVDLNDHSTTISYTIKRKPTFVGYLKLNITVGKENPSTQIYFMLEEGDARQVFRLLNGVYELKMTRDVNGKYLQVK